MSSGAVEVWTACDILLLPVGTVTGAIDRLAVLQRMTCDGVCKRRFLCAREQGKGREPSWCFKGLTTLLPDPLHTLLSIDFKEMQRFPRNLLTLS